MRGGEKGDQSARSYWHDLFLTKQQQQQMKNVVLSPPSPQAITTRQLSVVLSRAFPYCVAFRWKKPAWYCQSFSPEQCRSSYSHTAFQLWQQENTYGLIQCIIQRSFLSQRGKIPCSDFAQINNKYFSNYFPDFWCGAVCPPIYVICSTPKTRAVQRRDRCMKSRTSQEGSNRRLISCILFIHLHFYLQRSCPTVHKQRNGCFPQLHTVAPQWHHPHCALFCPFRFSCSSSLTFFLSPLSIWGATWLYQTAET